MQIYRSKYLANLSFKVCAKGAHDSDGVGGSGGDGADGHSDGDDRAAAATSSAAAAPKKKGKKKGGKRARLGQRGLENEKRK